MKGSVLMGTVISLELALVVIPVQVEMINHVICALLTVLRTPA